MCIFFSSRAGHVREVVGPLTVWKPRCPKSSVALGSVDGGVWERSKTWPTWWAAAPWGKALGSPRGECLSMVALGAAGIEPFQTVSLLLVSLFLRLSVLFLLVSGHRQSCSLVSLPCVGLVPVPTPIPCPISSCLKPLWPVFGLEALPVPHLCARGA